MSVTILAVQLLLCAVSGLTRTSAIVEPADLWERAVPDVEAIARIGKAMAMSFDTVISTHIAMLVVFCLAVVGRQISGTSEEGAVFRVLLGFIAQLSTAVLIALSSTIPFGMAEEAQDFSRLFIVVPELILALALTVQVGSYSLIRLRDRLAAAVASRSRARTRSLRIRVLRARLGQRASGWKFVGVVAPWLMSIGIAALDASDIPTASWWKIAVLLSAMSVVSWLIVGIKVGAQVVYGHERVVLAVVSVVDGLLVVPLGASALYADRGALAVACVSAVVVPLLLASIRVQWLVVEAITPLAIRIAARINAAVADRADRNYRAAETELLGTPSGPGGA
jgi:hypothetical protein